jgi:hypothetical protein
LAFRGRVTCDRNVCGPIGLTLAGAAADRPNEMLSVAFSAPAPAEIPEVLEGVSIHWIGDTRSRIESGGREWTIEGAVHVHREVADAFYEAVPPRPVPLRMRMLWRLIFALAGNSVTRRLLR